LEDTHPKYIFLSYAIFGVIVGGSSIFLNAEAEMEYLPGEEPWNSDYSSSLRENQTIS